MRAPETIGCPKVVFCLPMLLSVVTVAGCFRAPIQSARVVLQESFDQRYEFCAPREAYRTIASYVGEHNRCADANKFNEYVEMAEQHQLAITGQIDIALSIFPQDLRKFYVEGTGRHLIYSRSTKELLGSSTFTIIDDGPHWLNELSSGAVTVRFAQDTIREYSIEEPRYSHRSVVYARVHLIEPLPHVYAIDYNAEHEIGVSLDQTAGTYGQRAQVQTIGFLQFRGPRDLRKVVDLRARDHELSSFFLEDDYAESLSGLALPSTGGGPVIGWLPKVSCDERRASYLLAGDHEDPACPRRELEGLPK